MDVKLKILWLQEESRRDLRASVDSLVECCTVIETSPTYVWIDLEDAPAPFDLILCCIEWPTVFNRWLIARLRYVAPAVPIMLVTSTESIELAVWALRSGLQDVLTLPLSVTDVITALSRVAAISIRPAELVAGASARATLPISGSSNPLSSTQAARTTRRDRLMTVKNRFEADPSQELPEHMGAGICHVSTGCFSRSFKQEFGESFIAYKTGYRIERAKELLAVPSMSIADVASLVGFTDPSYFSRAFREVVGSTPSEFRSRFAQLERPASRSSTAEAASETQSPANDARRHVAADHSMGGCQGPGRTG